MTASKKYIFCLLPIFVLLHQARSFNVEELCAKRCLYGRGGVLCNCNAMHFNGKRSGFVPGHVAYPKEHNSKRYNDIPESYFSKERSLLPENVRYGGDSLYPGVTLAMEDVRSDVKGGFPMDSWEDRQFGKSLYTLSQEGDSGIVSGPVKDAFSANDNQVLPMILLKEDDAENLHNVDGDEDDAGDGDSIAARRLEAMTRIKAIMSAPSIEPADIVSPASSNEDLAYNFQKDNAERSRQHLFRIQRVLSRVRQRRSTIRTLH